MTEEDGPGLATIRQGVQEWVNNHYDDPTVVRDVVVLVETVQVHESGAMSHAINYTIPTEGTSMAAAVGLCRVGEITLMADANGVATEDDD